MAWDMPESEQAFAAVWQNWLENMAAHEEYVFVIRHAESLEFMGLCGLHRLKDEVPLLGIWIKENQHGHKYGYEAVDALVRYALEDLNLQRVIYLVAEENWASRKVIERLGGKVVDVVQQPKYRAVIYDLTAKLV